jgi:hypothetical protein
MTFFFKAQASQDNPLESPMKNSLCSITFIVFSIDVSGILVQLSNGLSSLDTFITE